MVTSPLFGSRTIVFSPVCETVASHSVSTAPFTSVPYRSVWPSPFVSRVKNSATSLYCFHVVGGTSAYPYFAWKSAFSFGSPNRSVR